MFLFVLHSACSSVQDQNGGATDEALDFALVKAGKLSEFKLKVEQNSVVEADACLKRNG